MLFMNEVINNIPLISVITLIEVLGFNNHLKLKTFLMNLCQIQQLLD